MINYLVNHFFDICNVIISLVGFYFIVAELKEMRDQKEQSKKEIRINSAISIAREFQDIINNEMGLVLSVLGKNEYGKKISLINDDELSLFTIDEFNKLCKKYTDLAEVSDYTDNPEAYLNDIANAYCIYKKVSNEESVKISNCINCDWKLTENEEYILKEKDTSSKETCAELFAVSKKNNDMIYYSTFLINEYNSSITTLLNKLEYLTMSLNANLADEEILYNSLHQLFLKTVKLLYPVICKCNGNSYADKYYTHIIETYNRWANRYEKEQKAEDEMHRKCINNNSKF